MQSCSGSQSVHLLGPIQTYLSLLPLSDLPITSKSTFLSSNSTVPIYTKGVIEVLPRIAS